MGYELLGVFPKSQGRPDGTSNSESRPVSEEKDMTAWLLNCQGNKSEISYGTCQYKVYTRHFIALNKKVKLSIIVIITLIHFIIVGFQFNPTSCHHILFLSL